MQVCLKSTFLYFSLFLGLTAITTTTSVASVPKPAGIVTQVTGQATLHRVGLTGSLPVKFRDRVFLQDKIHTQEETFVRVLLGGKALVTVGELSVLTITEDLDHATIDIQSGTVGLSVARPRMKPGEYIEIRTPHAVAAVRGTKVFTHVAAFTNMAVLEGFIDIAGIGTPSKIVKLTENKIVKADLQELGLPGKMSAEEIKVAQETFEADKGKAQDDSPLDDTVAKDQSDQAAALAEALAPAPDKKGSDEEGSELQTEESSQRKPDYIQKIPAVLSTKDLEEESELEEDSELTAPKTLSTGQPQTFSTASFSGGEVNGTDDLTVTGKTTVNSGTNTVKNSFTNDGGVDINGGSISFDGGGSQNGDITTQAGTTLEFGGGSHTVNGDVTSSGMIKVSAGVVNVNGGTYNVTGNSTTLTGGTMTFNAGATLTSLGAVSISNGSLLRLLSNATLTNAFTIQNGTLEFGGGTQTVTAASSFSGPGKVLVSGGNLDKTGDLFALSGDLTPLTSLFQQIGGATTVQSGDALAAGTHSLDASGTTDALFDISGGTFTTAGGSSDIIESRTGGGTVTTGGSAVALSGTGSMTLKGGNSSVLQAFGAGSSITTGDNAVSVSGNAILDLDDQISNDVALIQNAGSLGADGSVLSVSDSAEARVGRSVGRLESGGQLTTTNGGHVLESTGGTTTLGNSVLDLIGSTSQADISGYVVHATGGQINGPALFNLVDVNAGELNTDGGILKAEGDDRIILDSGTTDAIVDITSADGTHDLGTTNGEAVFNLSGSSATDTPLTKKDGGNNDMAVDQTLLASSGATSTTKQFLIVDQALFDASAPLLKLIDNAGTPSTMTANPGAGNGFIDLANQAVVRNNTNTMPMLTLSNSTLNLTTGHLLALNQSQFSVLGDFISLSDNSSLNINSANGFLVFATGNSALSINGAFINFGGAGGNSVTLANTSISETINGLNFFFTGGATNSQVTVNGTPIQNPGLGTITPGAGHIQVDGTQATVTIQGS